MLISIGDYSINAKPFTISKCYVIHKQVKISDKNERRFGFHQDTIFKLTKTLTNRLPSLRSATTSLIV